MGRLKPSVVLQPQAFRKDLRAKQAKAVINKSIPALLASDARARKGVAGAELIADPPPNERPLEEGQCMDRQQESPPFEVSIHAEDTITAALRLYAGTPSSGTGRVGILNMASPLRPGGGVLNGATSQEEFLCVRTTLYPSLQESFYRLPEIGGVWTPDVLIFRDGGPEGNNLAKGDRVYVGVVSAAMLRFPELEEGGRAYSNSGETEMVEKKMRAVMRVFQARNLESVVLGAWGCGAYGNPVEEIAKAWRKVLRPDKDAKEKRITERPKESWSGIRRVVFAINDINTAREFAKHFGEELIVENVAPEDVDQRTLDQNDRAIEELKSRIAGLEAQIPEARTELLKHRLQEILTGLKLQVAGRMAASEHSGHSGAAHTVEAGSSEY
ncbi:predicted protein [Uncinocarpus reesii 1704]|uniref:Microbial-type PARG catalytic domain-containing protein n=1 Tax=Uncinocarpus reesii (strain UAMH 1704) TaxID=336963 RepID=C4JKL6_UNCRE|nr:uncharacterized protein UREG_02173 [Uncinocarpus reesii 1704]EEP77324.1 predicted protein [Uncinocarpus reesii 1704]